jgi:hypothetical protein
LEFFLAIVSIVAGSISAIVFSNIRTNHKNSHSNKTFLSNRKYREELDMLLTEKSIVTGAIAFVFEAFQKGKLNRIEFDRLVSKYNEESQTYEDKIKEMKPMADISDLKALRSDLLHLVKEKITDIDTKLLAISKSNSIVINSKIDNVQTKVSTDGIGSTILPFGPKQFDPVLLREKKKLKQIENEIDDALKKLTQHDQDNLKTKKFD